MLQSDTSLMPESDFLPCMAVCQERTRKLQIELLHLNEELESLMAVPRLITKPGTALYQALQQVSHLYPAYEFSLRGFITVMPEAFVCRGCPLVSCNIGKVPGSVIREFTYQMEAQLLVQHRRCLIKSHVAALKLLVYVALLRHNQLYPRV